MRIVVLLLTLLCIAQFLYILHMRTHAKKWLDVLHQFRKEYNQKIFTKGKGILSDISYELNGIIAESQQKMIELKQIDEANKQILTSLSHDVRTPLASLLGYLEALTNGLPRSDEKEYIEVAYRKANDLKSFIDMLFEWFKLNSNEQHFEFKTVDLNEFTREILIQWLPTFEQSHISLIVNIDDDDLPVLIDKIAYNRMINNLIENAIKHGNCSRISISLIKELDTALLKVANDGQTIPPNQLPFIFERLYKCDAARSDKGTGLGLAITKELVAAMHGEIHATSIQGKDTTFYISLPLAK